MPNVGIYNIIRVMSGSYQRVYSFYNNKKVEFTTEKIIS